MINNVVLMGRMTADAEVKLTQSGTPVTSFSIAVERSYKQDGERQTDFINIVAWRGTAEFIGRHFHKGDMIAICGAIQTRKYEDKNGNKITAVEVVADNVSFCGSKKDNSNNAKDYACEPNYEGDPFVEALQDSLDLPF